jgi:polygalacturonase
MNVARSIVRFALVAIPAASACADTSATLDGDAAAPNGDSSSGNDPPSSRGGGASGGGSSGASGTPESGTSSDSTPTLDASDPGVEASADGNGTTTGPAADAHADGRGMATGRGADATAEASDSGTPVGDGACSGTDASCTGWDQVPIILGRISAPTFPNLDCNVTNYGGVGDGVTDNTQAFASAIADCAARGGGRVVTPAGTFFTGPIEIKSNIDLYVAAGATIMFSTDPAKYLPPVEVSWEGSLAQNYRPLLWAHDATNVAITGLGTIDGNASQGNWYAWLAKEATDQTNLRQQDANGIPPAQRIYGSGHFLRPGLIEFMRCTNVLFDGFTAQHSPFWTIHPVLSTNITARNFHSVSDTTVVNTDGFDPESCSDVLIQNATIQVGDDAVAIKAGRDRDGMTYYTPSQNIVIQNSTMLSRWGGVTIGSEMSAGVRNVYVEDSTFGGTVGNLHYGFFIKSAITRGGFIENINARRITVGTVDTFLYLTGHYVSGAVIGPTAFTTFDNLNIDTATVNRTTSQPFFIAGSDATEVATGIHLSNITVSASASPALAAGSGHYQDLTTSNVVVNGTPFNPPTSAP